jgi:integrase
MTKSDNASAKYPFQPCKLYDSGGDVSKQWVVEYYVFNRDEDKLVRRRVSGFNRIKTVRARKAAARELMQQIDELLRQGYTEGSATPKIDTTQIGVTFDLETFTLKQALIYFINHKNAATALGGSKTLSEEYRKGYARISENMFASYKTFYRLVVEWLSENKWDALLLSQCNLQVVQHFFLYLKEKRGVGNKTYNNYRGYFSIIFNFYISSQELPIKNPITKVEALTVEASELHLPFSNAQLSSIQETLLQKGDKQLLLFISFIYYTFARPAEEVRLLQVKDIREKTIFIPSKRAKNNKGEHITIHQDLEALIEEHGLRKYPKDYYVFTADQKPGEVPAGVNYFYKRHKKLLEELGLADESYTLYGYKHTGAINLYNATKDLLTVQRHCRHSTAAQTETYLRKYGVIANEKALQIPRFGGLGK